MSFDAMKNGGIFRCPVCQGDLILHARSLICRENHTFDLAKSGYVNLLRANSKNHGDDKGMVAARRAFLEKGYYGALRQALSQEVAALLPGGGVVLDSGCGEGYYTASLTQNGKNSVFGIDISSRAAAYSARHPGLSGVAVASAYDLPVKDACCDLLTNVFAPFCREEFSRVLKSGAYLINVIPAERHLWELKCAIYDAPYENTPDEATVEGFSFLKRVEVTYPMALTSKENIASLLLMTPYFYRTDKKGHARAEALESIDVTASFYLLVYQKN